MTEPKLTRTRLSTPCRCGSGQYCRRHLRYGLDSERRRIEVGDPHLSNDQQCGGGCRVIRKATRD